MLGKRRRVNFFLFAEIRGEWRAVLDVLGDSKPVNTKHLYNVGPTSKTLCRRCTSVIQMFCVFWELQNAVTSVINLLYWTSTTTPVTWCCLRRNEWGLGHHCAHKINWARRTSWGWWGEWDDTALHTQDSKFEPWPSEAEYTTSRSRRLPTILNVVNGGVLDVDPTLTGVNGVNNRTKKWLFLSEENIIPTIYLLRSVIRKCASNVKGSTLKTLTIFVRSIETKGFF